MYLDPKRALHAPQLPLNLFRPDQFGLTDAKTVAALFAIGAPIPQSRATLPDVDMTNIVIVRRRSLLDRIAAAYRAFAAETNPFVDQFAASSDGKVIPFRRLA